MLGLILGRHARPASAIPAAVAASALLLACAVTVPEPAAEPAALLPTVAVTLPDGSAIEAELAETPEQQARGLMYRAHLAADRGMLFVGDRAAPRAFWMYRCRIPLDMIWMDGAHRIVEIVRAAPPCPDPEPGNCPSYGGNVPSVYVLELAAGQAAAHGLEVGERIGF